MLHDEAAGAAHHVEAHQLPPVVRVLALVEGGQGAYRALMAGGEGVFPAQGGDLALRADADVGVLLEEEGELGGQIQVALVVRGGRQQDALAVVAVDVVADDVPAPALPVSQVVGLVEQHHPVTAGAFRQFGEDAGQGHDTGVQAIAVGIVLPHGDQVFRADNEGLGAVIVLEDLGQGGGDEGFAQAHHVPNEDPTALVEMVGGDLDRRHLKIEEGVAEDGGDAKFQQAGARLLGQVIGHLEVNVIGRDQAIRRPTGVDDGGQFLGDVDTPALMPAVLEPVGQFGAGIMVQDIDVQLPLAGEPGHGEVAAADEAGHGVVGVPAVDQIELGVQAMRQEDLDQQTAIMELAGQLAQGRLVLVAGRPQTEL